MAQYQLSGPLGYQQISVGSTAVALTVPNGTRMALIAVETEAIRFRDDGTAPTTSLGFPLAVGAAPFCYVGAVNMIQMIATTSTALVDVLYYG